MIHAKKKKNLTQINLLGHTSKRDIQVTRQRKLYGFIIQLFFVEYK